MAEYQIHVYLLLCIFKCQLVMSFDMFLQCENKINKTLIFYFLGSFINLDEVIHLQTACVCGECLNIKLFCSFKIFRYYNLKCY